MMNFRIPLIVFAVASVMTASTAIAAMSMQKAYSIEVEKKYCVGLHHLGEKCFTGEDAKAKCEAAREADIKKQQEESDIGFGSAAPCHGLGGAD